MIIRVDILLPEEGEILTTSTVLALVKGPRFLRIKILSWMTHKQRAIGRIISSKGLRKLSMRCNTMPISAEQREL